MVNSNCNSCQVTIRRSARTIPSLPNPRQVGSGSIGTSERKVREKTSLDKLFVTLHLSSLRVPQSDFHNMENRWTSLHYFVVYDEMCCWPVPPGCSVYYRVTDTPFTLLSHFAITSLSFVAHFLLTLINYGPISWSTGTLLKYMRSLCWKTAGRPCTIPSHICTLDETFIKSRCEQHVQLVYGMR